MKCSRIGDIGLQEYNQFRLSCRHPDNYLDSIRLVKMSLITYLTH